MGATGIGRAVSREAENPGSEKKVRFGQYKAGPYQRFLCPGWLQGTQEQALSGRHQAVKKAASGRCLGQNVLREAPWFCPPLHLPPSQHPRGPRAPIPVSGTPHGLAPSLQVPAADG